MMTLAPQGEPGHLVSRWGCFNRPARRDGNHIRFQMPDGQWESWTPLEDTCDFVPDPTEQEVP